MVHGKPTWGYTVSTHAPAREQSAIPKRRSRNTTFQLMPPRGGNRDEFLRQAYAFAVSTHAPARGQSKAELSLSAYLEFQLMPPRGGNLAPFALRISTIS